MEEIRVDLGERSYSILIGDGIIEDTGEIIREWELDGKVLVVTNPTVAEWYLKPLTDSLIAAGFTFKVVMVPDGEVYKNLEEAEKIYNLLISNQYDRKSLLIALGGGVIGDLTGFVAATYLRGVRFIQIPTTLLAQVDASVGGKVAVNHPRGKNLIGSFYQPSLVISDVGTLLTLPETELHSGVAEVIKHGLIMDENYFQFICGEIQLIREANPGIMTWIVAGSCNIKSRIVEADEKESSLRAILNYGHTIGHALETITDYTGFKHGAAVAVGMIAAAKIAWQLEVLKDASLIDQLIELCGDFNLPVRIDGFSIESIIEAIYYDKKMAHGKVNWILPCEIGKVIISAEVSESLVREVLKELGGSK